MKHLPSFKLKAIVSSIIILTMLIPVSFMNTVVEAQTDAERNWGLITRDTRAFDGYNFFKTLAGHTFHLTNNAGRLIHTWGPFGFRTQGAHYLLENGHLLFGEARLKVHEADWDGTILWTFYRPEYRAHHDYTKLPNGNLLTIAWETKTRAEAVANGRDPDWMSGDEVWPDAILEWDPSTDTIVWEWHTWDHLVQDFDETKDNWYGENGVAEHPELVDINFGDNRADWLHFNAIFYNPLLDQIAISCPNFDEIWIIDHSTTTAEAAGHTGGDCGKGGDLLYRWGNPQAYRAGTEADRQLGFEHDVQWITPGYPGEGNLLIFNNQAGPDYSSVVEIVTPLEDDKNYTQPATGEPFLPEEPIWEYVAPVPSDFFSRFISGAWRAPNGNTVINSGGQGMFFEVTPDKEIVWKYMNPVAVIGGSESAMTQGQPLPPGARIGVHRNHRYAPDYPGLVGKDLTPSDPIELYPISVFVDIKPGSDRNPVNCKSKGKLPVAILGTAGFDVTTIDPSSVWLEGFPAVKWAIEDVSIPIYDEEGSVIGEGPDGFDDLILKFDMEEVAVALGLVSDGDVVELQLTGYSSAGWFLGGDNVVCKVK
jgi:hypothetical protein